VKTTEKDDEWRSHALTFDELFDYSLNTNLWEEISTHSSYHDYMYKVELLNTDGSVYAVLSTDVANPHPSCTFEGSFSIEDVYAEQGILTVEH